MPITKLQHEHNSEMRKRRLKSPRQALTLGERGSLALAGAAQGCSHAEQSGAFPYFRMIHAAVMPPTPGRLRILRLVSLLTSY